MKLSRRFLSLFFLFYIWLPYEAIAINNNTPSIGVSNTLAAGNTVLAVWTNWDLNIIEAANFDIGTNPPTWTNLTQLSSSGVFAQRPLLSMDPFTGTAAVIWLQQNTAGGETFFNVYGMFYYGGQWQPSTFQNLTDTSVARVVIADSVVIDKTVDDAVGVTWVVAWCEYRQDTSDRVISSTYGQYNGSTAQWVTPAVQGPTAG